MKRLQLAALSPILLATAFAQSPQFEVASVKAGAEGFRFSVDQGSGGPGTDNPGMFRCGNCTLATLIAKAFRLQSYQIPGRAALPRTGFQVNTRIAAGATEDDFLLMLQNLLKERFALAYHFEERPTRGYHLTIAKGGAKLKESTGNTQPTGHNDRWSHSHTGMVTFGGQARFNLPGGSIADLVAMLSDQLARPVDDQTGLKGKYDFALTWSGDSTHAHPSGEAGGGHNHGPATPASTAGETTGPTLFNALQSQLGLKLVEGGKSSGRVIIIDHIDKVPLSN